MSLRVPSALRGLLRLLESARLATWLLAFLGVWCAVATALPQTSANPGGVTAWRASQPILGPIAAALGLNRAFTAPLFIVAVALLAVSTALCAWRRTRVAIRRSQRLAGVSRIPVEQEADSSDLKIGLGVSESEALDIAERVLRDLGVRARRRGDALSAVSWPLSPWGSPVFHWGLLAIMLVVLAGSLTRSEGLMGVPVGKALKDVPSSYGVIQTGAWHVWESSPRSIRVDRFEPEYVAGGVDRGPTPIVSVVAADGRVLKSSPVYPNSPLQVGSLTIHPSAFGFFADLSLIDASGAQAGHATQLIDISEETTEGTIPMDAIAVANPGGEQLYATVTVPMERGASGLKAPSRKIARLTVRTKSGQTVSTGLVAPGNGIELPSGATLKVDSLGFYARLAVVHDATIPWLYGATLIALFGLGISVFARQQLVVIRVEQGESGRTLVATLRLWRNAPTTKDEIRDRLESALCPKDEEDAS